MKRTPDADLEGAAAFAGLDSWRALKTDPGRVSG